MYIKLRWDQGHGSRWPGTRASSTSLTCSLPAPCGTDPFFSVSIVSATSIISCQNWGENMETCDLGSLKSCILRDQNTLDPAFLSTIRLFLTRSYRKGFETWEAPLFGWESEISIDFLQTDQVTLSGYFFPYFTLFVPYFADLQLKFDILLFVIQLCFLDAFYKPNSVVCNSLVCKKPPLCRLRSWLGGWCWR